MRLLPTIAALAATASAAPFKYANPGFFPNTTTPARIILTNSGNIFLANYDGARFTTTLQEAVDGSPSWVAFAEPDLLYAVDENSDTTRLFRLDLAANSLEETVSAQGSTGVVHLELNRDRTRMLGAGYGQGSVDVWDVEGGKLELLKTIVSDGALGPNKERQAAAHPHQAVLDPSGRFFAVNDLGTDAILLIDSAGDAFDVVDQVPVAPAGCGPRHGAFYPPGAAEATHYMVVCEIMNLVVLYSLEYADDTIRFTQQQTASTLGHTVVMPNTTAAAGELAVASASDLYVSNRQTGGATDTLAHFKIDGGGAAAPNGTAPGAVTLRYAGQTPTGGTNPRMFSVGAGGAELLVGNQGGAMGAVALRRGEDGVLDGRPAAGIEGSVFGEDGAGPMFVKQIA